LLIFPEIIPIVLAAIKNNKVLPAGVGDWLGVNMIFLSSTCLKRLSFGVAVGNTPKYPMIYTRFGDAPC